MPKQSQFRVAYFCVQMLSGSREVIVHAPLDGADDDGNGNTDDEDNTVTWYGSSINMQRTAVVYEYCSLMCMTVWKACHVIASSSYHTSGISAGFTFKLDVT